MPPYEFEHGFSMPGRQPEKVSRSAAYEVGQDCRNECSRDAASHRLVEESWRLPESRQSRAEASAGRRSDNPYLHLSAAHDLVRARGMEAAQPAYEHALRSADRIEQAAVRSERMAQWREGQSIEIQLRQLRQSGAPIEQMQELEQRRQAIGRRQMELHEMYLAPATARANYGLACIRSGNPRFMEKGERLIEDALKLRPEIEFDANFQRHRQDAYREGSARMWQFHGASAPRAGRDLYKWDQPGGADNAAGRVQHRRGVPDGGQPRRPVVPHYPLDYDPHARHRREPGQEKRGNPEARPANPTVPSATERRADVPKVDTESKRPNTRAADGGGRQDKPAAPGKGAKELEPGLAESIAKNPLALLLLGYFGWKMVKKGSKWVLDRKAANGDPLDARAEEKKEGERKGDEPRAEEKKEGERKGEEPRAEEKKEGERKGEEPRVEEKRDSERLQALDRTEFRVERTADLGREVHVGKEKIVLFEAFDGWMHGKDAPSTDIGAVKVHVSTNGVADLARVQKALLPELVNDPVLKEKISAWKTMDPLVAAGEKVARKVEPTGREQGAKAFTIYIKDPKDATIVQERIDKILAEKGLSLDRPIDAGNVDRVTGASNRVGVVRDLFDVAVANDDRLGAKIDPALVEHIKNKLGVPATDNLTDSQLRQIEKEAGLRENTLVYDRSGKALMLIGTRQQTDHYGGKAVYYMTEAGAQKDSALGLTDRPAIYALARKYLPAGLDPVDLAQDKVPPADASRIAAAEGSKSGRELAADERRVIDRSGKDAAALESEARMLEQEISSRKESAVPPFERRSFMDAYIARANGMSVPEAVDARPAAFTQFIRDYFAGSRETGGVGSKDPAIQRIEVVAAPELNGNRESGGRIVFKAHGEVFTPSYREGNDFVVENKDGTVRRIAVDSATIEFRLPAEKLAAASSGSESGRWMLREVQASIYQHMNSLNNLKQLKERAAAAGVSVEKQVAHDRQAAEKSALFVEFELHERKLAPAQEPLRVADSASSIVKPIELAGEKDVVTRFHPDGRVEVVERGKVRELNDAERDKQVNEAFERLIKEAREAKDEKRVEELVKAQQEYAANPESRQAIREGIAREMGKARGRLGTGVGVLIVVSAALSLYLASRKSSPHRTPDRAPVSGK